MLLTDRLVYLHAPKTGGTFVRTMLHRLHGRDAFDEGGIRTWLGDRSARLRARRLVAGAARAYPSRHGVLLDLDDKHGPLANLPESHRGKVVMGTVRNPYDLYVSEYEFGWWRRPEHANDFRDLPGFDTTYAHFPDLSFGEYVRLINPDPSFYADADGGPDPIGVGAFSRRFATFYHPDPAGMLKTLDDAYIAAGRFRTDFAGIRFLATDRLNVELHDALLDAGYPAPDIAFIRTAEKVRPATSLRRDDQRWQDYYDPELKAFVRERERMLFELFPQFDR